MRTHTIPGGWEADSRPDGQYVAAIWHGSQLATDHGPLQNPPNDAPRWPVLSADGRIACQGQNDPPKGWEWDGTIWWQLSPPCGVWPVIYGHDDVRHISHCQPGVGSQGWRYVAPDGRLVTGDETVLVRHGLNEWTDLSLAQDGSILVGQDNGGAGVGVWAAGARRLLTPGACYNVRAKWEGLVSISCYNVAPDGVETRIFWLTMAELEALPVIVPPVDPPPIDPPIDPPVEPPVKPPIKPPVPERYQAIKGVTMQVERGWLIGPGDKVLHMDGAGRVTFLSNDLTDDDLVELAPIAGDRRATFRPVEHPEFLIGADATQFTPSGDACKQYYGTTGPRGFYESWDVGIWASGIVTAMVPYIEQGADHGRHWGAASLTWVRK